VYYVLHGRWRWFSEIRQSEVVDGHRRGALILSAIPAKNVGLKITAENIANLHVTENFESETPTVCVVPYSNKELEDALGSRYFRIETKDFGQLSLDKIKTGVNFIDHWCNSGYDVVVNCKAGRARSGTMIMAFLLKERITEDSFGLRGSLISAKFFDEDSFSTTFNTLWREVYVDVKRKRRQLNVPSGVNGKTGNREMVKFFIREEVLQHLCEQ
jgi:hypothetical protein